MSVGGVGIPRLQDLAYIEVAIGNVAQGATFEQVRRALVDRAAAVAREGDTDGSYSARKWDLTRSDTRKHVHNTADVLKELMRLGWVEKHILPSGPNSAYAHADSVFALTSTGERWAALVATDRRAAYNALTGVLLSTHPQFEGFLRLLGARPDSGTTQRAVRECLEETGIIAEITGFLGVCTNPHHIVAFTDGEIRQQYENTYIGRPVGGEPTINDEADGVRFVQPTDLDQYDIHPSMRRQIGDYLAGAYPYFG